MAHHRLLLLLLSVLVICLWACAGVAAHDSAVELDAISFKSRLLGAPASWALVEFYANWCPHCRVFKPQYERVARLFNGIDAVHPGVVFMAKVDCALKKNSPLCDRFNIEHYPTLVWSQPSKLARISKENQSFKVIENSHNAELLLQSINKRIGQAYTLEDIGSIVDHPRHENQINTRQRSVLFSHDIEEATAEAMDTILNNKLLNQKSRSSFIQFLQLLVVHHPSRNCRRGTADLLQSLQDLWPSLPKQTDGKLRDEESHTSIQAPDYEALERFHICGDHVPRQEWVFCQGSRNDTRGYSCGLWLLFHALTVRVEDQMASSTFRTICSFVANFFKCEDCRQHFVELCSSAKTKISSRRQLVLWLWAAHNQVNDRVGKEETASGTGDLKFPKSQWPPASLCKSCWNMTSERPSFFDSEVYSFIVKFYGHDLTSWSVNISSTPETQRQAVLFDAGEPITSAMSVPAGAALAIAFASCSFGATAFVWRTLQKRRKQVRRHD